MKSAEQRVAHWLGVGILIAGVSLGIDRSSAAVLDGAVQGLDKHSVGGMASTRPVGEANRGEELYNASCIVCHGSRAVGAIGPRLAGNPILSNEQAFWKIVYDGRHVMPSLKGAVTEQQMADIQAWMKTLP